jgi:hypothetical protein
MKNVKPETNLSRLSTHGKILDKVSFTLDEKQSRMSNKRTPEPISSQPVLASPHHEESPQRGEIMKRDDLYSLEEMVKQTRQQI